MKNLVLIHGLNNTQAMWDEIADFYQPHFKIHRLALLGHDNDYERMVSFSYQEQIDDLNAKIDKIPGDKYVIAYSLGALTVAHLLEKILFKKVIFLAPAFKVRPHKILTLLSKLKFVTKIPSFPSKDYCLYKALPINVYIQMLEMGENLVFTESFHKTLTFCSEDDNLVSYSYLAKNLPMDRLVNLKRKRTNWHPAFQHMVFDQKYLGDKWKPMLKRINEEFQI